MCPRFNWTLALTIGILATGCDDRATRVALQSVDQQARQNLAMANVNEQVATGVQQLLAADSESRSELLAAHRELLTARNALTAQWNDLEHQRRKLDDNRRRDSLVIPLAQSAGVFLMVVVVLGFCWCALGKSVRSASNNDNVLAEILIEELVSDSPRLLTSPQPSDAARQIGSTYAS